MNKTTTLYRDGKFYKLFNLNGVGVLQINGVLMHRIKGTTALLDATKKVEKLSYISDEVVLDIGTCLGYTAIALASVGAKVITIERDKNVLELAKLNPLSKPLFEDKRIKIIIADAAQIVKIFPSNYFGGIINDPPLLKFAGELYSDAFYRELLRVLKPKSYIFCYTGRPGSRYRNVNLLASTAKRLLRIGFCEVVVVEELCGVMARKPFNAFIPTHRAL